MRIFWLLGWMGGVAFGGVKSGHAEVELLQGSTGYTGGKPVEVGVKLTLDPGWHTYWVNPGEGGMPVKVEWSLPEGWVAGPVLHPVPKRFMTGELAGYGYEGKVVFPVFLTPGPDSEGAVEVKATVSWLTCDDSACVPGKGEAVTRFQPEVGEPTASAGEIGAALKKVPQPVADADLEVAVAGRELVMTITLPEGLDGAGAEVFPATPGVLDHSREVRLGAGSGPWEVRVAPNEYAGDAPNELELVLAGGGLEEPLLLGWSAE